MSSLQSIENKLIEINPVVFEHLCDSYLKRIVKDYRAFSRTGVMAGKNKTTKGTPDSYFLLPNGNYIFIEKTTNKSDKNKLSNDIKACFDFKKCKIPTNKIDQIILCFNWDIDQLEVLKLNKLAKQFNSNTSIKYIMLQDLALDLSIDHKDLVYQYLGLPMDLGQIVSLERFISEYNKASNGISTPIDNIFMHREAELVELKENIEEFEVIILTGSPGVGKTKLAIEGVESFLDDNQHYSTFCISYKYNDLSVDLAQKLRVDKDYVLFVDDANRIASFNQVIGFLKNIRSGKLKIVVTVRDYALKEIEKICHGFNYIIKPIPKLSDNEITDVIKVEPFNIKDSIYHREIRRIADGNPRLAIMASKIIKAEGDISALNDVSALFDNYFSTFVIDNEELELELNLKCLGIVSFFYTLSIKDKVQLCSILELFDISYYEFITSIERLSQLELLEIQYDLVRISEQNLSTYFFYKTFIKDELLPFNVLLTNFFNDYRLRFVDTVIPANNTFGIENVMDKIQPSLKDYWKQVKSEEENAFGFLSVFWFYLVDEAFEFAYHLINALPVSTEVEYIVTYNNNEFNYRRDKVIELLENFYRFQGDIMHNALELIIEYIRKKVEKLPEFIYSIKSFLIYDREDERYRFWRQNSLFNTLFSALESNDLMLSKVFFELSKTFLEFHFNHTEGGNKNTIYMYDYVLPNVKSVTSLRGSIWSKLIESFENFPEEVFEVLQHYVSKCTQDSKELIEFDSVYVIEIIQDKLNRENFDHCYYVQEQVKKFKKRSIEGADIDLLRKEFTNSTYEVYLKVDWNRIRDRESFEYDNYGEYEKIKEEEVRTNFLFNSNQEVKEFFKSYIAFSKRINDIWAFERSLNIIIDENFSKNFEIGFFILDQIIALDLSKNFIPTRLFHNQMNSRDSVDKVFKFIKSREFRLKPLWELTFYESINNQFVTREFAEGLIMTIKSLDGLYTIHLRHFRKYQLINPSLIKEILEVILEKNRNGIRVQIWVDFFDEIEHLDVELVKAVYIEQNLMGNVLDSDKNGFLSILKRDLNFLREFVDSLFIKGVYKARGEIMRMGKVWGVEGVETVLEEVLEKVIKNEVYFGISEHFANSFFKDIDDEFQDKANEFLRYYTKKSCKDVEKMKVIVDLTRHSMKHMFEEITILYVKLNQSKEDFSKISWRGNSTSAVGDVLLSDIEKRDWEKILLIVKKSELGYKLIPIVSYINDKINGCSVRAEWELKRKFQEKYF